MKYARQNFDAY